MGIAAVFLFSLAPAGLVLFIGTQFKRLQPPEKAAQRTIQFLIGLFLALMSVLALLDFQQPSSMIALVILPIMVGLIPIIYLHWRATSHLQTRMTGLTVALGVALIALLSIRLLQNFQDFYFVLILVMSGAIITALWRALQWLGLVQWIVRVALAMLLIGVLLDTFAQNSVINAWPQWLQTALTINTNLLWPVIFVVLTGRIVYGIIAAYEAHHPLSWRAVGAAFILAALMFAVLAYQVTEQAVIDQATDGMSAGILVMVISVPAIGVAMLLAWKLKHKLIGLVFASMIVLGIFVVFSQAEALSSRRIHTERAAQINQAVQDYYQDNGQYPSNLSDLMPRYLLFVPRPVLFHDQDWCYEGGGDYYRFGYVDRPYFGARPDQMSINLQDSVGESPSQAWACDVMLVDYRERYAPIFVSN